MLLSWNPSNTGLVTFFLSFDYCRLSSNTKSFQFAFFLHRERRSQLLLLIFSDAHKIANMSTKTKITSFIFFIFSISLNSVSSLHVTDLPQVPDDGGKLWVVLAAGEHGIDVVDVPKSVNSHVKYPFHSKNSWQ